MKNNLNKKGITLLLSIFIVTTSLTISFGVFTVFLTELRLSGDESASVAAYYAAESGIECVLFNDDIFSTSSQPSNIDCGEGSPNIALSGNTFSFVMILSSGACTKVEYTKEYIGTGLLKTIKSIGRNKGGNDCETTDRSIERALQVTSRTEF